MKRNYSNVFNNMVENTLGYLQQNGLKSMVLGISGGIDSTVVSVVCHEISKRTNHQIRFIGVSLPSRTNEYEENEIASTLGELCDDFHIHYIEEEFNSISNLFNYSTESYGFGRMNPLQLGNIKARIRMMYIYNLAHLSHGLTMDTDNLTEHYLGFFTIGGDVFDLNCGLSNLWKHEVYELANWIVDNYNFENMEHVKNAIMRSIAILPTDGNGVMSGGDLAQIAPGLTYTDVDDVLQTVLDCDSQRGLDLEAKHGKSLVQGIVKRYYNSEFKRKHLPIVMSIKGEESKEVY